MNSTEKGQDLSWKIKVEWIKRFKKIIAEEKARDGYLVISDKKGGVIKIPAKDL